MSAEKEPKKGKPAKDGKGPKDAQPAKQAKQPKQAKGAGEAKQAEKLETQDERPQGPVTPARLQEMMAQGTRERIRTIIQCCHRL